MQAHTVRAENSDIFVRTFTNAAAWPLTQINAAYGPQYKLWMRAGGPRHALHRSRQGAGDAK